MLVYAITNYGMLNKAVLTADLVLQPVVVVDASGIKSVKVPGVSDTAFV